MQIEGQEQDVSQESSPEVSQEAQSAEGGSQGQEQQQQTQQQTDQEQYVPYSRFKEVIEGRNTMTQQMRAYEQQLQAMQQQMQHWQRAQSVPAKQENPLLARLKGIDPEFGGAFEKVFTRAEQVEQLEQRIRAYEEQSLRQQGVNMVNSLHSEHKVPKDIQDFYNSQIDAQIRSNPNARLEDIPNIYKMVHESFSKYVDSVKRSEKEAYVTDKKADSVLPVMQKGKTATPQKGGFKYSKDPDEARKQLVENALKSIRQSASSND